MRAINTPEDSLEKPGVRIALLEAAMPIDSLHLLDTPVVKVEISQGTVAGTISVADSADGNALILRITNPFGAKVELVECMGERRAGWRGRKRERFRLPMHGIPHCFENDGARCLAWAEVASLPSMKGVVQILVQDNVGRRWPVENVDTLLEIVDRLTHPHGHPSGERGFLAVPKQCA